MFAFLYGAFSEVLSVSDCQGSGTVCQDSNDDDIHGSCSHEVMGMAVSTSLISQHLWMLSLFISIIQPSRVAVELAFGFSTEGRLQFRLLRLH